jgi:hypothetical protein
MTKICLPIPIGSSGPQLVSRLGYMDISAEYRTGRGRRFAVYLAEDHRVIYSSCRGALAREHWNSVLGVTVCQGTP